MSKLAELKNICQEKKDIAYQLKRKFDKVILDRDIRLLPTKRVLTNEIEIKTNEGMLEIVDRRESAFLWCFEIVFNNSNLRFGDAFTYNSNIYSVEIVEDIKDKNILIEIEKVILEYNSTISFFQENSDFTKYTYEYYCDHEEVTCPDIFNVYDVVLNRLS